VAGDTLYNMLKLQDGLIGADERPETPNKILKAKVLSNPFPDIKPRQLIDGLKESRKQKKVNEVKLRAKKDFGLLSFGDEAEEEEEDLTRASKEFEVKSKSSHDLLADPKLSAEEVKVRKDGEKDKETKDDEADGDVKEVEEGNHSADIKGIKEKLQRKKEEKRLAKEDKASMVATTTARLADEDSEEDEKKAEERRREAVKREIKALKREMRKAGKKEEESDEEEKEPQLTEEERNNDMLLAFHREKKKYKEGKQQPKSAKKGASREEATLKMLAKFADKLHSFRDRNEDEGDDEEGAKEEGPKKADGGSDDESVEGDDWMRGELKFERLDPVLAKDASTKDDDWFDIYDPRNPVNKRRRLEKPKKEKRSDLVK